MKQPGKFVPVVPFTPATYPFCLKFPYCKEIIMLSKRWNPAQSKVTIRNYFFTLLLNMVLAKFVSRTYHSLLLGCPGHGYAV